MVNATTSEKGKKGRQMSYFHTMLQDLQKRKATAEVVTSLTSFVCSIKSIEDNSTPTGVHDPVVILERTVVREVANVAGTGSMEVANADGTQPSTRKEQIKVTTAIRINDIHAISEIVEKTVL